MPTGIYKRTKPVWNKKEKVRLICWQCGGSFSVHECRKNTAKYCSKKCFFASKKGKQTWSKEKIKCKCLECGKIFYVHFSLDKLGKNKYCSHKCYGLASRGRPAWNKGKKLSPEHRKKAIQSSLKGRIKQANMKGPTSIEKIVYDYLVCKGVIFEKQKVVGNRFIVDVYIPSLNLVIEADGEYWHSTERGIETDKRKNDYLLKQGYNLIRLSEEEIKNGNFKERLVI